MATEESKAAKEDVDYEARYAESRAFRDRVHGELGGEGNEFESIVDNQDSNKDQNQSTSQYCECGTPPCPPCPQNEKFGIKADGVSISFDASTYLIGFGIEVGVISKGLFTYPYFTRKFGQGYGIGLSIQKFIILSNDFEIHRDYSGKGGPFGAGYSSISGSLDFNCTTGKRNGFDKPSFYSLGLGISTPGFSEQMYYTKTFVSKYPLVSWYRIGGIGPKGL